MNLILTSPLRRLGVNLILTSALRRLGVNLRRQCVLRCPLCAPTPRADLNTYHEREARRAQAASCRHAGARAPLAQHAQALYTWSQLARFRTSPPPVSTSTALFCEHPCPLQLPSTSPALFNL